MRPSANRHVLAILRKVLAPGPNSPPLEQHRLARRVGCSVEAIRRVEKGRVELSEALAIKIEEATGVSLRWLMRNDLSEPPVTSEGYPYTLAEYERHQAQKHDFAQVGIDTTLRGNVPGLLFKAYNVLHQTMFTAIQRGRHRSAMYRFTEFVEEFRKEFTGVQEPFDPRFTKGMIDKIRKDLERVEELIKVADSKEWGPLGHLLLPDYTEDKDASS